MHEDVQMGIQLLASAGHQTANNSLLLALSPWSGGSGLSGLYEYPRWFEQAPGVPPNWTKPPRNFQPP